MQEHNESQQSSPPENIRSLSRSSRNESCEETIWEPLTGIFDKRPRIFPEDDPLHIELQMSIGQKNKKKQLEQTTRVPK
jgi:hypothetical protein